VFVKVEYFVSRRGQSYQDYTKGEVWWVGAADIKLHQRRANNKASPHIAPYTPLATAVPLTAAGSDY
jgi:hypothetical protein